MHYRSLFVSILYHYEVKNENFSLLCALSNLFWPYLLHSIVQRLHLVALVALKESQRFCPVLILCYLPMFSNVFIWVTCLPDSRIKISLIPLLLAFFCTFVHLLLSLRISSVSLLPYSSTLGACRCLLRKNISLLSPLVLSTICLRHILHLR